MQVALPDLGSARQLPIWTTPRSAPRVLGTDELEQTRSRVPHADVLGPVFCARREPGSFLGGSSLDHIVVVSVGTRCHGRVWNTSTPPHVVCTRRVSHDEGGTLHCFSRLVLVVHEPTHGRCPSMLVLMSTAYSFTLAYSSTLVPKTTNIYSSMSAGPAAYVEEILTISPQVPDAHSAESQRLVWLHPV